MLHRSLKWVPSLELNKKFLELVDRFSGRNSQFVPVSQTQHVEASLTVVSSSLRGHRSELICGVRTFDIFAKLLHREREIRTHSFDEMVQI